MSQSISMKVQDSTDKISDIISSHFDRNSSKLTQHLSQTLTIIIFKYSIFLMIDVYYSNRIKNVWMRWWFEYCTLTWMHRYVTVLWNIESIGLLAFVSSYDDFLDWNLNESTNIFKIFRILQHFGFPQRKHYLFVFPVVVYA